MSASTSQPRDPRTGKFVAKQAKESLSAIKKVIEQEEDYETSGMKGQMESLEADLSLTQTQLDELQEKYDQLTQSFQMETIRTDVVQTALNQERATLASEAAKFKRQTETMDLVKSVSLLEDDPDMDIKVAKPTPFDGDPKTYKAFIGACESVFNAQPKRYASIKARLIYVLSYCTGGKALAWREMVSRDLSSVVKGMAKRVTEEGSTPWDALKQVMDRMFFPLTLKIEAQHKLPRMRQGSRSIEEYMIDFTLTQKLAELGDEATLLFFKQGLKPAIRNKIYESGEVPQDLDGWANRATAIDIGWREAQLYNPYNPQTGGSRVRATNTPPSNNRPRLSDEEYQKRRKEGTCFKCGKKGHMAKACYSSQNRRIQEIVTEERKADPVDQDFI